MRRTDHHLLRRAVVCGVAAVATGTLARRLHADPPEAAPATLSAPTLLQQLSDETQRVYRKSRHSMVRVKLPTPQWLDEYNQRQLFLQKWGSQLDPQVREKILEQQERSVKALHQPPATSQSIHLVTTRPSSQPDNARLEISDGPHTGDRTISLFAIGLLVDDAGHAVFPVYVDRKSIGDSPLPALTGEGAVTTATFVGSDAKTNLTVLQLADHSGAPAALGHGRLEDGTLTLMIASDGGAKLVVWNSQHPEAGFAVLPDGAVAGFGFNNHFLGASTAKPIVDQLVATGEVHRAVLGVMTQEVDRDDALRRERVELGSSPAIRITAVEEGSAAARGGVQPDDLVLAIGDQIVGDAPTFAAVIATRRGETVLKVLRGKTTIDLTVNLQPK